MAVQMFVMRYGNSEESLDGCIVFIESENVTPKDRSEATRIAEDAGIKDADIQSVTALDELPDGLYPSQAYTG